MVNQSTDLANSLVGKAAPPSQQRSRTMLLRELHEDRHVYIGLCAFVGASFTVAYSGFGAIGSLVLATIAAIVAGWSVGPPPPPITTGTATEPPSSNRTLTTLAKAPDLARLPRTGEHLFGRERELAQLDDAWAGEKTNIISLVAWGGVGKSALVAHWLGRMAQAQFRGATRVYGWSFYSQGTKEGEASADEFVDEALRWFDESNPEKFQRTERARRLAELIQGQRTLLVLDGLEPLQQPPGPQEGRLKDQSLAELLRLLEWQNPGLVVITTRVLVDDIRDLRASTAPVVELGTLSAAAGAQLLQALKVQGEPEELEAASREFGGHGLALNLLGTYLADILEGDVRRRGEVSLLEEDVEQGGHARRIMRSYEKQFGDSAELAVLHLIGLFDRPAKRELIDVLRRPPQIDGLNDRLVGQSERQWQRTLARLRHAKLLSEDSPDELDAHPLVREHFGARLREERPEAWRAGHGRLYEHLKTSAKELPDTLTEMAPLFQAMHHGCQAGRHREALDEVYLARILRRKEFYTTKKLGAFGADLAAVAGLFDPPFEKPVATLTEAGQAFILNQAAFRLHALGRLREAVAPMRAGLERRVAQKVWTSAGIIAGNLSGLHLTLGDVAEAVTMGEASVAHADRSEEAFQRMGTRTAWADALHQAGEAARARALFEEAEALQAERQLTNPRLYSVAGFRHCDLVLAQGHATEARKGAAYSLEIAQRNSQLLDIALAHLSLGRAALALDEHGEARTQLDQAVDGLRQAGTSSSSAAACWRARRCFGRPCRPIFVEPRGIWTRRCGSLGVVRCGSISAMPISNTPALPSPRAAPEKRASTSPRPDASSNKPATAAAGPRSRSWRRRSPDRLRAGSRRAGASPTLKSRGCSIGFASPARICEKPAEA